MGKGKYLYMFFYWVSKDMLIIFSAEPIRYLGCLASQIYTCEKITSFSDLRPPYGYLGSFFLNKMNAGMYAHR
jgi:hypothetical protein